VIPATLMAAAQAGAATAATPTAPPPVTILTSTGNQAGGDYFISPFGDQST
jgi:hypothetical protein